SNLHMYTLSLHDALPIFSSMYINYACRKDSTERGCSFMSRRRGIMSDELKEEIAKELGFYDTVQREGWGGIRARDAGNMVKRAIEIAEQNMGEKDKSN